MAFCWGESGARSMYKKRHELAMYRDLNKVEERRERMTDLCVYQCKKYVRCCGDVDVLNQVRGTMTTDMC